MYETIIDEGIKITESIWENMSKRNLKAFTVLNKESEDQISSNYTKRSTHIHVKTNYSFHEKRRDRFSHISSETMNVPCSLFSGDGNFYPCKEKSDIKHGIKSKIKLMMNKSGQLENPDLLHKLKS